MMPSSINNFKHISSLTIIEEKTMTYPFTYIRSTSAMICPAVIFTISAGNTCRIVLWWLNSYQFRVIWRKFFFITLHLLIGLGAIGTHGSGLVCTATDPLSQYGRELTRVPSLEKPHLILLEKDPLRKGLNETHSAAKGPWSRACLQSPCCREKGVVIIRADSWRDGGTAAEVEGLGLGSG